jgi:hypothetical protein
MKLKLLLITILLSVTLFTQKSTAQLLQWNTFSNAGTETIEPSVFNNVNIAATNLTQGSITAGANGNRFGGSGWFDIGNTVAGNTIAEAVAGNNYIQFIVTPNAGFSFTPTSLVFNWDFSASGPRNVVLRSSADSFVADLGFVAPVGGIGSSNTITITGLTNITTVTTFRVYGYGATNTGGTGGFDITTNTVNVQLNGTTTSSCASPLTQATALIASNPTTDGFNLAWTAGSGNGTMVVVRPTASANTLPSSGTAYAANLAWASAGQIDVNNRVVFRAAGAIAAPITGLTPGTQYTIMAYEYNTVGNCYNLTSPATTTIYTLSLEPTVHAVSFSCLTSSATQINLTFSVRTSIANARAYIILQSAGAPPTGVPTDGNAYIAGDVIGDATVVGTTILDGSDTTFAATGLSPGITYYFTLIPYNLATGIPSTTNYLTAVTIPSSNCTTSLGLCYTTGFEDATKGAYPSGDVTLSGIIWNLSQCLIGTLANDYKVGLKSARIQSDANAYIEMQQDKTTGISTISFNYAKYGSDTSQGNYKVEYSKDGGNSWFQIGTEFTPTTAVQTFSATLNQVGAVRVRIVYSSGPQGVNFRTNIDEVQLCNYTDTKEIEVFGNSTTIQNGSLTYTTINDTDYGDGFFVGDTPIIKTYTITNRGTGTLNLSSLALTGDASFTVSSGLSSSALVAGASATFSISFSALTTGVKTTLVTIGNDDPNESPFTFTLRALSNNYIKCALNAKQTIGQQDFEAAPATPTLTYTNTGGVVAGGTNYGDNRSTKTNMFTGAQSFQETGSLQTITFATTDVSDYKNIDFTFNIGAYTTVLTPAGLDAGDYVKVFVSKDGGTTWIPQLRITGFSNSIFDINSATGPIINFNYNPSLSAGARYAPTLGSTNTFSKTFVIKNLPNITQLKVKIELATDNANEIWAIDNIKLEGQLPQSTIWDGVAWSAGAPVPTKKAIFDGNYNTSTANIDACDCEIKAARTVTVQPTHYVKTHSDLKNSGALLVQDQGSLIMVNDYGLITNTGTMQVNRATTPYERFDYTYWSSPMTSTTIASALGTWRNDYTFRFATANFSDITTAATGLPPADGFDDNQDAWVLVPQATVMSVGQGYIAMAPTIGIFPTTNTVSFTGTVNNGIITTPIVLSANGASAIDDFNLIGNPYPSSIYANDFINKNTNISGTLYFWTHVKDLDLSTINPGPQLYNFRPDDYATYNLSGGTASVNGGLAPTGYIASGQGFLVEAGTAGTVTFNNSMRSSSYANTNFYRNANQDLLKDRIWVSMQNNLGMYSQQLLAYLPNTTLGFDWAYDGIRGKAMTYIHFYSHLEDEEYKIQSRGDFNKNDMVILGYQSEYAGDFKIKIDTIEGILNTENVYIEDKLLNVIHDLKQSDYTFTTQEGKFDNRFILRYTNQNLGNTGFDLIQNNVLVFASNNGIEINSRLENIKSYQVYDVLGRTLETKNNLNTNQSITNTIVKSSQALIVKITLENGQVVTKKIIF